MILRSSPRALRPVAPLIALLAGLAFPPNASSQAPTGFKDERNVDLGYEFFLPRTFKSFPTQPGDPVLRARYVREIKDRKGRVEATLEIWVVCMKKVSVTLSERRSMGRKN